MKKLFILFVMFIQTFPANCTQAATKISNMKNALEVY